MTTWASSWRPNRRRSEHRLTDRLDLGRGNDALSPERNSADLIAISPTQVGRRLRFVARNQWDPRRQLGKLLTRVFDSPPANVADSKGYKASSQRRCPQQWARDCDGSRRLAQPEVPKHTRSRMKCPVCSLWIGFTARVATAFVTKAVTSRFPAALPAC